MLMFLLILIFPCFLFAQSKITVDQDANIDVGESADLCAEDKLINGSLTGMGTWCDGTLPVLLSYFSGVTVKNNVSLQWKTEMELNNSGFKVERMDMKENLWKEAGFVNGSGTTNEQKIYSFEDKNLFTGIYKYRLKQIDYNGGFEYYELQAEMIVSTPKNFHLSQNYPNPSNPKSKIGYELPLDMKVMLIIYDIAGKEVDILVNNNQFGGYHSVEFDGTDLSSGIYFYRLIAEGNGQKFTAAIRLVLVK